MKIQMVCDPVLEFLTDVGGLFAGQLLSRYIDLCIDVRDQHSDDKVDVNGCHNQ
jgi:hypothetical protein